MRRRKCPAKNTLRRCADRDIRRYRLLENDQQLLQTVDEKIIYVVVRTIEKGDVVNGSWGCKKQRYRAYNSALWSNYGYRMTTKATRQTTPTTDKPPLLDFCYFFHYTCTGWAKKTVLFSDLITLWRIVPERRAVCQNFGNFIQKKGTKLAFQWV